MGWPNNDPEGWNEVERSAVKTWLESEINAFYGVDNHGIIEDSVNDILSMLQAEHEGIFQAMVEQVGYALSDAEADYLERKLTIGEGL